VEVERPHLVARRQESWVSISPSSFFEVTGRNMCSDKVDSTKALPPALNIERFPVLMIIG